jgi:hypothetical protein
MLIIPILICFKMYQRRLQQQNAEENSEEIVVVEDSGSHASTSMPRECENGRVMQSPSKTTYIEVLNIGSRSSDNDDNDKRKVCVDLIPHDPTLFHANTSSNQRRILPHLSECDDDGNLPRIFSQNQPLADVIDATSSMKPTISLMVV